MKPKGTQPLNPSTSGSSTLLAPTRNSAAYDLGGSTTVRIDTREFADARSAIKAVEDAILAYAAHKGAWSRETLGSTEILEIRHTGDLIIVERKVPAVETPNLRSSIVIRAQRWLEGSLGRMSDEEVLKLVEAQSPAETIAELLVAAPEVQQARDSDWSELLLRGADAKSRISEFAGGLLSPSEAARLLKISVPGVKQRLERRKLLAVPLPGGQRGFPGLQFREDGRVREGVAEVAAAGAHIDPWTLLSILVDEVEDTTGGTLLERLGDEPVRADVLGRIAGYGEHGAA
jgi:hypothetical protein